MSKLHVIIGSTRPGRAADLVAPWVIDRARNHGGFDVEVLDLRDWALPMFGETFETVGDFNDPTYSSPIVRSWNHKIAEADAFLVITPEYNHSVPAVLKNAIDSVFVSFAFRNKPADVTSIAIVAGPEAENTLALLQRSAQKSSIRAEVLDAAQAHRGFRIGKYDLVVESDGKGGLQYLYDPARPESVLSRAEVDDALQAASGRKNPLSTSAVISSEPGSRYIDFLIPGLIGMNVMNAA